MPGLVRLILAFLLLYLAFATIDTFPANLVFALVGGALLGAAVRDL